jgi:hypothetical protein
MWRSWEPAAEHPAAEIDGAVSEAFSTFKVDRLYCDPGYQSGLDDLIDKWAGLWGPKRVVLWRSAALQRKWATACVNYVAAVAQREVVHDGDSFFAAHIRNARRRYVNLLDDKQQRLFVLGLERVDSVDRIDGARAAALSWEARGDAVAAGALQKRERRTAFL